jgi:hypothetical protein
MVRKAGRDPTRRNKNIGTAKQGRGKDNRMVIPDRWSDLRMPAERLSSYTVVSRSIHGQDFPFVVEKTRKNAYHACTVDDLAVVLRALPANELLGDEDVCGLAGVVLRQKTRKQETLIPSWATLYYAVDLGPIHGPAIYLNASEYPVNILWSKRNKPDQKKELDRLREDADEAVFDGRNHKLSFGQESVRSLQLYRSLLHEVGHLVHYQQEVDIPCSRKEDDDLKLRERLNDEFFRRAPREREDYAHNFAATWKKQLSY